MSQGFRKAVALSCIALLACDDRLIIAHRRQEQVSTLGSQTSKVGNDQLDSLVAPIALYPDPLLAQVLAASTYPLEIIQLQQWLSKHNDLKDKALVDAVQREDWDPSVQAMVAFPEVVKQLAENIKWTSELGNAFLAQQSDVMDAIQRMRMKAKSAGQLNSNGQQKVETKVVESKTVVVIEPANPQVVYVPSYNPLAVYGPPVYPYPPIYYPPTGYYAAGMAISFGVGVALGAAWGEVGVGVVDGGATTLTSTSTTITSAITTELTSITGLAVSTTAGSTIQSTAAGPHTRTVQRQIDLVAALAASHWRRGGQMHPKVSAS